MNEYNGMPGWMKAKVRDAIGHQIQARIGRWPSWHAGFRETGVLHKVKGVQKVAQVRSGGRRRLIRVVRHSPRRPDEVTVDIIGGKMVVDCLVRFGVLVGDDDACLVREAEWYPSNEGDGRVVVDVFELVGLPEVVRKRSRATPKR